MRCCYCGHDDSKVVDSRSMEDGSMIRRRRECLACGKRFSTFEKIEKVPLIVIKKDGSRQSFDREKLISGLLRACEKRPISLNQLEQLIDEVESAARNTLKQEISTEELGEMVMSGLKQIDEVAYVRFASVYRQFKDVNTFMDELKKLLSEK